MTFFEMQLSFLLDFSDLGLAFVEVTSKLVDSKNLLCFIICMKQILLTLLLLPNLSWALNSKHLLAAAAEYNIPHQITQNLIDYFSTHSAEIKNKNYVTFVDFSRPSSEDRMFIINTETGQTEKFLVAHGKNSGDLYAEKFSNEENSKMSSLGYYLVEEKYRGEHGSSLKLSGLSSTNSKARQRGIVMHPADYVSDKWVAEQGRIGRSWGCFALNEDEFLRNAIDKIQDGSLLIAFK
jgi:hypothetical protein